MNTPLNQKENLKKQFQTGEMPSKTSTASNKTGTTTSQPTNVPASGFAAQNQRNAKSLKISSSFASQKKRESSAKNFNKTKTSSIIRVQPGEKIRTIPKTQVGQILNVQIHGLGPENLGFVEMANGFTIFVPNVSIGDLLQIEVKEVHAEKSKYAIAKILKVLTKSNKTQVANDSVVRVGDTMEVTIEKPGPKESGLAFYKNFTLIVLKANVGQKVQIQISRVKEKYAFGKLVNASFESQLNTNASLKIGFKYTMTLPKTAKYVSHYLLVKMENTIVFIKMGLGAKLGDFVQIQVTKVGQNFAVAKILKLSPMSQQKKQLLVKQSLKKMLTCGMHFGERAIRCNANMKKFIWLSVLKQESQNILVREQNLQTLSAGETKTSQEKDQTITNILSSQERPKNITKNRPIIRKGRHFINLFKTRRCLTKALTQLGKYAAKGRTFLFVGTKKSASALIARAAMLSKTSFFVNTRWLGGMLTNWKTILKSISQIRPILKEKQKIIQNILEKRQKMKKRLILKVNLLRKNSEKLVFKGKKLIAQIQKNKPLFMERSNQLLAKKVNLLEKNQILIAKYDSFHQKKILFSNQSEFLQQKGNQLLQQKSLLLRQFNHTQKQIFEFERLFSLGQEILKANKTAQEQGKSIKLTSFNKLTESAISNTLDFGNKAWLVPNPSNELFEKIVLTLKAKYHILDSENSSLPDTKSFDTALQNKVSSNKPKTEQGNTIVLSKLLSKFTRFLPFMKIYLQSLNTKLQNLKSALIDVYQNIQKVRQQLKNQYEILNKIQLELKFLKLKLSQEKGILNLLKIKLKRLASEQKLLKFLPRLRYLPTPANKMAETIQILMKKFVDPKMTFPMEQIYNDKLKYTPKKIAAIRKQKWQRLEKYFGGIAKMAKMKKKQLSNNVAIIIGQKEEMNAVQECKKLGIPIFSILDTNNNPRFANHWIPANDDSRNSVKFVLEEMLKRICLAQKLRSKLALRKIRRTTKARSF